MTKAKPTKPRSASARALGSPLYRCKVQRDRRREARNTHRP